MIGICKHGFKIVALITLLILTSISFAHELQPSLLEIRELSDEQFDISWRAPTYYNQPHPARLQLPETWQTIGAPTVKSLPDAKLHRRVVKIPGGKSQGSIIRFVDLESTITDVFVRFYWIDGSQTSAIARPNHPWVEIAGKRTLLQISADYIMLGIDHILSGFDHLAFVLLLLCIVKGWRKLVLTVTSFTVAHSLTLAAVSLGPIWVPGPPVEAIIALSILFLAVELVKINRGLSSLTSRYSWLIAFVFGLLHGFGFAGVLNEIGLPEDEVSLSLLSFNVGVEIGQLLFICGVLMVAALFRRLRISRWTWSDQLPAYVIGSVAAFWFIQRISSF